jgi:hypothetical protein
LLCRIFACLEEREIINKIYIPLEINYRVLGIITLEITVFLKEKNNYKNLRNLGEKKASTRNQLAA